MKEENCSKHRYSTAVLIAIITIAIIVAIATAFSSEEVDELCAEDEKILYRSSGTWGCGTDEGAVWNESGNTAEYQGSINVTLNASIGDMIIYENSSHTFITSEKIICIGNCD